MAVRALIQWALCLKAEVGSIIMIYIAKTIAVTWSVRVMGDTKPNLF